MIVVAATILAGRTAYLGYMVGVVAMVLSGATNDVTKISQRGSLTIKGAPMNATYPQNRHVQHEVFTATKGGLMAEASLGGQKLGCTPLGGKT